MERVYDMIVVGGGPAGYSAALYGARAGLSVLVLEKLSAGGQMALTDSIDNYPGFDEGIDGFSLGEKMQQGAERFGAVTELAEVYDVDLKSDPKVLHTSEGRFLGRTVVIATGAGPRELGIPGEQSRAHYCAACDGMRYRGRTVAVIGGGNSAVGDALQLARIAKKVYLIHRRDSLRAEKIHQDALASAENVEIIWNASPVEISESGILIQDVQTGEKTLVACDGIFVSIGRKPATNLVAGQLVLDNTGYIIADESTKTSIPGVFAAGDVRTKALRQVVTAVADGAMAVHFAQEYLG